MESYLQMKERHQREINEFPMFFAFDKKQFEEGMIKLGLKPTEVYKVYMFGSTGGYYRREDSPALKEMFLRQHRETRRAMLTDDDFLFEMFNYELGNHEYIVTCSTEDTLEALGLNSDEIYKNERLSKALQKACKAQRDWYDERNKVSANE